MIDYSLDPVDWLIEKFTQNQPSWHNSRTTYRLRYWNAGIKRYEFIPPEQFWLVNIHHTLRFIGVEYPERVAVIDLDEAGISARNK